MDSDVEVVDTWHNIQIFLIFITVMFRDITSSNPKLIYMTEKMAYNESN